MGDLRRLNLGEDTSATAADDFKIPEGLSVDTSWNVIFRYTLQAEKFREALSFLLGARVKKVSNISFERVVESPVDDGHSVRFDVVFDTGEATVDLELQSYDDDIIERALYYQAMMTAAFGSPAGRGYGRLRRTKVVFVCSRVKQSLTALTTIDPVFKDGYKQETLLFNTIRIFDAEKAEANVDELIPEGMVELLRVLSSANTSEKLGWFAKFLSDTERKLAMKEFNAMERCREQGLEQGRHEKALAILEVLKNLILAGNNSYKYLSSCIKGTDTAFTYEIYVELCKELGVAPKE